jgi:hypothetical protein
MQNGSVGLYETFLLAPSNVTSVWKRFIAPG